MELITLGGSLLASIGFIGLSVAKSYEAPTIEGGKLNVLNLEECEKIKNCFYQNADNPYALPLLIDLTTLLLKPDKGLTALDQILGGFFLNPNQALTVFGKAPSSKYWGGLVYLLRDGFKYTEEEIKSTPGLSIYGGISGSSLTQGFSNFEYPGVEQIAIIVTRNQNVFQKERSRLTAKFPNITPIPCWVPDQAPLNLPISFILRTAIFPEGEIEKFKSGSDFTTYRVTYPNIGFSPVRFINNSEDLKTITAGILPIIPQIAPLEPSELYLQEKYDAYAKLILKNYTVIEEIEVHPAYIGIEGYDFFWKNGYDCIARGVPCNFDNPQASYISSLMFSTKENQSIIVISVNHAFTQRCYYSNLVIYDEDLKFGIDSVIPESKHLFFNKIWDYGASNYRIIERSYVALPKTLVGPDPRTLLLMKVYVITTPKNIEAKPIRINGIFRK